MSESGRDGPPSFAKAYADQMAHFAAADSARAKGLIVPKRQGSKHKKGGPEDPPLSFDSSAAYFEAASVMSVV
jgi:hypothetical protein